MRLSHLTFSNAPELATLSLGEGQGQPSDWLVWQLVDSAFPTGGYAHSSGLEATWHHGAVRTGEELASFVEASLQQLGHGALPLVAAAYAEPGRLVELDQLCDAFTTNHVANRASRLQGRSFASAVTRVFGLSLPLSPIGWESVPEGRVRDGTLNGSHEANDDSTSSQPFPIKPPCGHLAPVFGAMARSLGLARAVTLRVFLFQHVRGVLAAAVRLNIVGPMEGQRLQHRLASSMEEILRRCSSLGLEDLCQTAPLLDLWQGAQDRLYSRLFQS